MARINGLGGTFPYSEDGIEAPYTDGIIAADNVGGNTVAMPAPNGIARYGPPIKRGVMMDYINSVPCVDTNTTHHDVLVGDS